MFGSFVGVFFSLRAGVNLGINSLQLVTIGVLFYDILWPYSAFIFCSPMILFFFFFLVWLHLAASQCVSHMGLGYVSSSL